MHGLAAEEIDAFLAELARTAVVLEPEPTALRAPDPADQHLCDLVRSVPGTVLVTGDGDLRGAQGVEVLAPREMVHRIVSAVGER